MIFYNQLLSAFIAISEEFNQLYNTFTRLLFYSLPIIWSFEYIKNYDFKNSFNLDYVEKWRGMDFFKPYVFSNSNMQTQPVYTPKFEQSKPTDSIPQNINQENSRRCVLL